MNRDLKEPDFTRLAAYIEGQLSNEDKIEVESRLKENKDWFAAYMELQEAIFLESQGSLPSRRQEKRILEAVTRKKKNYVVIVLKILEDKISVMSGDQEDLQFQGVSAQFSVRGENYSGPVTVTRVIDSREVTIIMIPDRNRKFFALSVKLKEQEDFSVELKLKENSLETVPDISSNDRFTTQLEAPGNYDLIFSKGTTEYFRINLRLHSG